MVPKMKSWETIKFNIALSANQITIHPKENMNMCTKVQRWKFFLEKNENKNKNNLKNIQWNVTFSRIDPLIINLREK